MTCDMQNENFITQPQQQPSEVKNENKNNSTDAIIYHNNSSKRNKFSKTKNSTNARMLMVDLSQTHQLHSQKKSENDMVSCLMEQKQKSYQQKQHHQLTIISKVFKQEDTTMAQQALRETHNALEEYLKFSHDPATATTTKTTTITGKRINDSMWVQQSQQNLNHSSSNDELVTINSAQKQHQLNLRPTFANTADPVKILSNLATISSSYSPSSLSSSPSSLSSAYALLLTPPPPPPIATTAQTVAAALRGRELNGSTLTNVLTIPVAEDAAVQSSQSKKQQCKNVCINSICDSKQKFLPQQKKKRQCKSANTSSNKNNLNSIRTFSKTNINADHKDASTDVYTTAVRATVEVITNSNNNTTTSNINKANNTAHNTTTSNITAHNTAFTASIATRPTVLTTAATTTTPMTYGKAFPLRQHFYQHTKKLECFLRAVLLSFVFVMSMQLQTVSGSTSMMNKHEPMFISRSETFKFVAGDTIVLPCEVANTDPYVVAWKRGIAILTAGSVKVTPDPRVRLVNGFNLQIRDAVPQDAGDYICQIATMEPREITHTVEILVPPRIHHISTSGHLQVKKGSSVRIECSASGNPTPNVTWSRKNNILPNGEEKLHSHILSIENVDRHKGGVYICTANNGVGQPASSQVVLHVLYPPEITVERPVVFSGEGHEAMLVCIVHGETQPEVIWFKDTMQLDTTERHIMENRGSRHTLIIRKVHPQDFGNYSCVAENQLGKSRKTLQLSGKPNVAVFNSPTISQYKDRYNISWTVESHTPIEEYKLSFRRLQQGQEVDNSIDTHSSSSSMLQMYGGSSAGNLGAGSVLGVNAHNYRLGGINSMNSMAGSGGYSSYGAGNVMHWGRNDWRDVVLPAIPTSHHYTQGMSYMIRGLDPDHHYEATVQARNRYGWSDYSQSFVFSTSSNDNEMRDLSVTFYGSKSARLHTTRSLMILTSFTSLFLIYINFSAFKSCTMSLNRK